MKQQQQLLSTFVALAVGVCAGALSSAALRGDLQTFTTEREVAPAARSATPVRPTVSHGSRKSVQTDGDRFSRIASALQETTILRQRHALYKAIGQLDSAGIREAIERAKKLPSAYYSVAAPLFDRWFALDPHAAAEWARAHADDQYAWLSWARNSPETALAEVHAHPQSSMARNTLEVAIHTLAGTDQSAVAATLARLPSDSARDQLLYKTVTDWAKDDPKAAFLFARSVPETQRAIGITDTALRAWINRDPEHAMQEVEALSRTTPNRPRALGLFASVAEALAATDPRAAANWVNGLAEESRSNIVYAAIARSWAKTDPVAALEWCIANGVDVGASMWMGGWGSGPLVAEAFAKRPEETLHWIESLPLDAGRMRLLEQALTSRTAAAASSVDVERVVALMEMLPADAQARVAYQIGARLAANGKFDGLGTWTNRLGDPDVRGAAIDAAVANRFAGKPGEKEALIAQFAEGPDRDAALHGIISQQWGGTPAEAAQTALRIADPQTRHEALDDFVIDWLRRDPVVARQWLGDTSRIPKEWSAAWFAEAERGRVSTEP
jgi:hypothetical protein